MQKSCYLTAEVACTYLQSNKNNFLCGRLQWKLLIKCDFILANIYMIA